jgi:hypothetical protein
MKNRKKPNEEQNRKISRRDFMGAAAASISPVLV